MATPDAPAPETPADDATPAPDTPDPERHVPISVVQAERAKRQALETELAEFRTAQEAAATEAAKKRGEFEQLYGTEKERADALAAKVTAYETREAARVEALTARNTARTEALPDHLKPLVPVGLDPDALSDWLGKASELGAADPTHPRGTRSHGGGPVGIPSEASAEVQRLAEKWGIEPELAWKRLGPRHRKAATEGKRVNL